MTTDERSRTRWPLPRRSATDRKLGGVAGGLGRAWRIDPILIRVAFVVLTLFGGSGVLLYCAGWLTMRGDGDEVSAIEALAGRGRSSVSPVLTIVLIVVGLASMGSIFSWGIPFWPVVVGAIVLVIVLRHRHPCPGSWPRRDAARWADDMAERASRWGRDVGDRAGARVDAWFHDPRRGGAWFGGPHGPGAGGSSTSDGATIVEPGPAPSETASGVPDDRQSAPPEDGASPSAAPPEDGAPPSPDDMLAAGRTPPAWDPLGAAPFAWDLPEPSPAAEANTADGLAETSRRPVPGRTTARIFLGLAMIVGSVTAAGVASGFWNLTWAAAAGITLAVLAVGLIVAALRGRGGRILIGPGVFVAVLTLALSVVGLEGTAGYGQQTWTVESAGAVADSYHWNAGQVTLDLSKVAVPAGETVRTDVSIGGGQVTVVLPADTAITARCSATVGQIECLGQRRSGVRAESVAIQRGSSTHGTIDIDVHSNAGQAVVRTHE